MCVNGIGQPQQRKFIKNEAAVLIKYLLVVLFALVPLWAMATDSDQWQIEEIQIKDGLPDSTVYSIVQDAHGFMWFGTTHGVARFDGHDFKVFTHDGADPQSISNNNAGNIFIDSENRLWIGTFGGGVNTLDLKSGELTRHPYSSNHIATMVSENVQSFFEDQASNIWIGTATGLYRFNDKELLHYDHDEGNSNSLAHSRIWDILEDKQGHIWVGTSEGLSQLDPQTGVIKNYRLPEKMTVDISSNQFRTLHLVDDLLWVGSSSGLYSFNLQEEAFKFYTPDQKSMKINDIYTLNDGALLLASMEGLYEYDLQKNVFKTSEDGGYWQPLSHFDVRNIYLDQSGLLWLATRDSGVIKIDQAGGLFHHHTHYVPESQKNEKNKKVWALEAVGDSLYLGTSDTVFIDAEDQAFNRVITEQLNHIPGIIRDIKPAQNDGMWVGGSMGLFYLSDKSLTAKTVNEPFDLVGIEPADVFSVEQTKAGEVWLALYNIGVLRWNPVTAEAELLQSYDGGPLTDLNINHIYQDSAGDVWIASNLVGVFKYSEQHKTMTLFSHDFNDQTSISSNRVKDIYEDSTGRLWMATSRGLNQFLRQSASFKHYHQTDGLLDDSVITVLEDSKQKLWLGYKFGLSRFDATTGEINNFVLNAVIRNDGLITRAAAIDDQDVLYLGSANGYYSFDPKNLKQPVAYEPPLNLTAVRINNKPLPFSSLLADNTRFELSPEHRVISFDFSVLDYKTPEQIQYHYRMVGLHEDWLDVSDSRHIELNNLNPGAYQLEIKATNNDGRWTSQKLNLAIQVHPVWWNRGWVRLVFVIVGVLMAWAFHYYRTYKIRKQNMILETQVSNRTTELRDLNEQLQLAANSDFLTGLPNRMSFIDSFEQKQKQAENQPFNSCIVLADIDHFKHINDRYGHSAGDEILKEVSHVMRLLIRQEDLIARWGGEEFIFYFENKDSKATWALVERIRMAIESLEIKYLDHIIPITLTFGICQKQADMSLIECINAADTAMYSGKSQGRNRAVLYQAEGC